MSHVRTESFFSSGNASAVRRSGGLSSSANARNSRSSTAREPLRDGAIRNRENLVVSNREIRQLFDTMKELGDCVKTKNAKLETMSVKLEDACKEVNELKTQLKTVLGRDSRACEKEATHRGPVPKQLKVCYTVQSSLAFRVSNKIQERLLKIMNGRHLGYIHNGRAQSGESTKLYRGGLRGGLRGGYLSKNIFALQNI